MKDNLERPRSAEDEVDLGFIFTGIANFFKGVLTGLLNIFVFLYRKKIVLLVLLILGIALGFLWQNVSKKTYKSNFIVSTNYSSTDYLYNKIESVNLKLKQKDTLFLKSLFGTNSDVIIELEIEPIINIYGLINDDDANAELFELLSEDEDMMEFVKDPINSRNYKMHKINVIIEGANDHESISANLFDYINDNDYYNIEKEVEIEYAKQQIDQNGFVRQQIDTILKALLSSDTVSEKLSITLNDNKTIDDLLERKKVLLNSDRFYNRIIKNDTEIVKIVDSNYTLKYDAGILSTDKKILVPFLLILVFLSFSLIKYFIKMGKDYLEGTK